MAGDYLTSALDDAQALVWTLTEWQEKLAADGDADLLRSQALISRCLAQEALDSLVQLRDSNDRSSPPLVALQFVRSGIDAELREQRLAQ